ncbi:MAG TPA: hypothetical protein VFI98_06355 [Pseudolabrys sp.]|nr:hypothetical protein [Pseudolabrys sp.]
MRRQILRAACVALCVLSFSGCVDSSGPVLPGARALLGQQLRLQFYTLHNGAADEPEQATYKWDGAHYAHVSGGMEDVGSFSVHPFEGANFIVQTAAAKRPGAFEYAVAHRLADGVYQVVAIDEDDAGPSLRARYCKRTDDASCRIETRKQLFAFARATGQRRKGQGGLVLRLADGVSEPSR